MPDIDYAKIDLLVLDVDGVMTDGRIVLTPSGEELKFFSVHDGAGIRYWQRVGKKVAIITGRNSPAVAIRAKDLQIDAVRMGVKQKLPAYEQILDELGMTDAQTAVVADDLMELPLMRRCAFPVAVANAVTEVRESAAMVTQRGGGDGAVREVVEFILRRAGLWEQILERYMPKGGRE